MWAKQSGNWSEIDPTTEFVGASTPRPASTWNAPASDELIAHQRYRANVDAAFREAYIKKVAEDRMSRLKENLSGSRMGIPDPTMDFLENATTLVTGQNWSGEESSRGLAAGSMALDIIPGTAVGKGIGRGVGKGFQLSRRIYNSFRTTRSFYTVQGGGDAARLMSGGTPWPSAANKAHFGEGLYTWGNIGDALSYQQKMSKYFGDVSIMEFRMSKFNYSRLSKINLNHVSHFQREAFVSRHSSLFGLGAPHNYDHIIRPTGTFGNEYFFTSSIFSKLRFYGVH